MEDVRPQVFVTGAGFTRAFAPDAPLLVDDFGNDELAEKVRRLPKAIELLESERSQHPDGFIDLERLMTRLDDSMPYDHSHRATIDEFAFLLGELKRALLSRLSCVGSRGDAVRDMGPFVQHCAANGGTCITLNYDDCLDEAFSKSPIWNPEWGYGFYCPSAEASVSAITGDRLIARMLLLKLHGSLNWRARLGYTAPYALGAITHHEEWSDVRSDLRPHIERHLEPEPVIVPPVLTKSGLVEQPVLRLVWSRAYERLVAANRVTFIGYSFPTTDTAARVLFSEALRDLPRPDIRVVGLEEADVGKSALKARYRNALGDIPDDSFFLDGARRWVEQLGITPRDTARG